MRESDSSHSRPFLQTEASDILAPPDLGLQGCHRWSEAAIKAQTGFGNIWRIDYQLRDGEDEAEAIREEIVRASVAAVLDEIGYAGDWDLEWWSIYSANTLALADYRDGRVFFVGDSAHIVPIFGVRGLNNSLADAENIGWKLG